MVCPPRAALGQGLLGGRGESRLASISSAISAEAREAACALRISCEISAYLLKPPWSSWNPFQFFFFPGDGEVCREGQVLLSHLHEQE